MLLRRDYGYAFIMNVNNPARNGTLNPVLLLLDQNGEIPAGCNYQRFQEGDPVMTVSPNDTFQWQNYNLTSANVPLDMQPIDFSSMSDDPTSSNYCVN